MSTVKCILVPLFLYTVYSGCSKEVSFLSLALCDMHPMRALFLIPRNPPPKLKSKKWWVCKRRAFLSGFQWLSTHTWNEIRIYLCPLKTFSVLWNTCPCLWWGGRKPRDKENLNWNIKSHLLRDFSCMTSWECCEMTILLSGDLSLTQAIKSWMKL